MNFLKKLFDTEYKELKRFMAIADEIEDLKEEYRSKTDEELASMTPILKEELANYFSKRNYTKAEQHFMECYKKRPDILMEASDINGELRLCMQIISTCEFESEEYGYCILDKYNEYDEFEIIERR